MTIEQTSDNPADAFKRPLAEATQSPCPKESRSTVSFSVDPSGRAAIQCACQQVSRRMTRREEVCLPGTRRCAGAETGAITTPETHLNTARRDMAPRPIMRQWKPPLRSRWGARECRHRRKHRREDQIMTPTAKGYDQAKTALGCCLWPRQAGYLCAPSGDGARYARRCRQTRNGAVARLYPRSGPAARSRH